MPKKIPLTTLVRARVTEVYAQKLTVYATKKKMTERGKRSLSKIKPTTVRAIFMLSDSQAAVLIFPPASEMAETIGTAPRKKSLAVERVLRKDSTSGYKA